MKGRNILPCQTPVFSFQQKVTEEQGCVFKAVNIVFAVSSLHNTTEVFCVLLDVHCYFVVIYQGFIRERNEGDLIEPA